MKRKIRLAVMLTLLVTALGSMTQAKTLTAAEKANIKYAQYLKAHETEGKKGYVESFAAVTLDDNTTPDLFEKTGKVAALSFLNGKAYNGTVRTWADMTVVYGIYPKTGVFSYAVYDSDGSTRAEFLYRKLIVRTNGKKDVYVAGMMRNDDDEDSYYNNAKENTAAMITKAEYSSLIKEYTGSVKASRITFYPNTASYRKKILGDTGDVASISLNPSAKTLKLDETAVLTATVSNADATVITWESNKPKVVSVEPASEGSNVATVKALKGGIATITASISGVTATCKVTVDSPSIELDQSSASLFIKKTLKLNAEVTGASKTVTWTSSKPAVATVSNGTVTGLKAGKTKITASANGLTASCTVTVRSMTENVKKLTAIKAGKDYIIKFETSKDAVVVNRKGKKLYINGSAVLTLHTEFPAYAIYLTDLEEGDGYKEVVELFRNSAGKSALNVYRYKNGKLSKAATLAGNKGCTVKKGFAYKKGQTIKTPGDGTIVMQQNLLLGGKEKITVSMKYEFSGTSLGLLEYDDESASLMTVKSVKNKLKKKMSLLDDVDGDELVSLAKKTSYKPSKLAVYDGEVYLKVKAGKNKGWLSFNISKVKYR